MDDPNQIGTVVFVSRSRERRYQHPREIIQANRLSEVAPAIARLDELVTQGMHAAGYLAYEAAPAFDTALACHDVASSGLPLLWFGVYDRPTFSPPPSSVSQAPVTSDWRPLLTESRYQDAIRQIRELIAAGDTYQVNYTFPMEAEFRGDSYAWFQNLCAAQNADFNAYLNLGTHCILSASPELFFRLDGNQLETRPMKGTRPRGLWPDADRRAAHELAASAKDRAENVMIVDLLRNDMGRVSETGSVQTRRLFELERYETVWQMTSSIASWTDAGIPEILRALFPSGSVTGAPKVRTMQIIRELEPYPRSVYCGAIGWWAPGRAAEFSVAIRTVTLDANAGTARYSVGSGVTWESNAADEYRECQGKASILTHARPTFELLESIRFDEDYYLIARHLARLGASADYFGFRLNLDAVQTALRDEAAALRRQAPSPWKVRLLLGRDGTVRVNSEPVKPPAVVRAGFAVEPVDETDLLLYHKTTRREIYEKARASRPDCDDVILWNRHGEITESATANVVLEIDGALLTPDVACGLLGGTFRAELLEAGVLRESRLTKDDLRKAASLRLINSVRKWIDVEFID